ncbi:hypothetical protein PRUPE_6G208300 [Prunus persica]|uniref:Alcohol dehydrogenase-like C-terminal domain-containing protein n=1 Tax=Prunus persica TaxID=3760 RepID=A0A251NTC3_PRUPE|nr:hypothetical protein PRUPE_6G208300 [Prunus persica]
MVKTPEQEHLVEAFGWAARYTTGHLSPFNFSRRHELVGEVTEVGNKVKKTKVGDRVGVGGGFQQLSKGAFMDSLAKFPAFQGVVRPLLSQRGSATGVVGACHDCDNCNNDLEIYCPKMVLTYSSIYHDGTVTYGGYSDTMVANERYIVHFPDNMPLDGGAPLLCAGITMYSPLKYFGLAEAGKHIGIVGLGGLGHVGVKFAKAFGAKVTVLSTSPSKKDEALKQFGADSFLVSRDQDQMQFVIDVVLIIWNTLNFDYRPPGARLMASLTVSAVHAISPLIDLLKSHGKLIMVGAPDKPLELPVYPLLMGRKLVAGSAVGGMKETQKMIDFAAKHNITAEIEVISMDYVNTTLKRLVKNNVRYRFVIDIGNTLAATKP